MTQLLPWETAPEQYDGLLEDKVRRVTASLAEVIPLAPVCFASPPEAYRARAEFRVWHEGSDLFYAMFDPAAPRTPVRIDSFPPAIASIQQLMPRLLDGLRSDPELRRKLFQVEFMGSTTGELLVTLAYHRALDSQWEVLASALATDLNVSIVGRSRKQKLIIGRDHINDSFRVRGEDFVYRQYEQAFAQPNTRVNEAMLNWAADQAAGSTADMLELYCGNGNFTLPLSRHFESVLATELSKSGTRAAQENIIANGATNVAVVRLSAEEVSQAIAGEREFRRLATLPKPLTDYALNTVFVDPPRAGLDRATLECVQQFKRILYISCNPETLHANLTQLTRSHTVTAFALFDQFPYTRHMECGVVLELL